MRAAPNNEEYERKLNKVNVNRYTRCERNMPKPPDNLSPMQLVYHAIMVGNKILAEEAAEAKKQDVLIKPEMPKTKLGSLSSNPIIRARTQVLNSYSPFRRAEIERMEKEGDTNNRFYQDFAAEVSRLTDIV